MNRAGPLLLTAAIALTACATPQQQTIMTWSPTGSAAIPKEQALAECRYDIVKDPNNFDRLFLMSGQSPIGPNGEVGGLSGHGQTMFAMCMRSRGYAPGSLVPYTAGRQP